MGGAEREGQAVNALIAAAGTRRTVLSATDLARVLGHVAQAGFDPQAREAVRGRIVGLARPAGGQVGRGDQLPPDEVHYLRHVVAQQEWPAGTTLAEYLASIRRVIEDPTSGVFVSTYLGARQLGILGHAGASRGPDGGRWILVDYRIATGHWTTAYQPDRRLKLAVYTASRGAVLWLRLPRRPSRATATT